MSLTKSQKYENMQPNPINANGAYDGIGKSAESYMIRKSRNHDITLRFSILKPAIT